jgi:V/A-type H+-transporting ATPase subunit A
MILSVSPPGGDFTEPVTQSCLRTTGTFLMLDTSLAHSRHFPAINWFQSYSLHAKELLDHFRKHVSPEWEDAQVRCRDILRKEEELREVVEIVGIEGIQHSDRLLMHIAEKIRMQFLCQNAYTEDAFSPLDRTFSAIRLILDFYTNAENQLNQGVPVEEILKHK